MSSKATNFFVRQDSARRASRRMVVLFGLGVIATIGVVYLLISLAMGSFEPEIFAGVFVLVGGGILLASLFKVHTLSQGGKAIALALGGHPVGPNPQDPDERKLRNVIEEMAVASGVPIPEIYVLDLELGINAFAAGYTPADAAIGVTRGAITNLNREELQGVIAHEFSHILNGDMKLNIRLIALIFGLFFLTVIGRILLYTRPSSSNREDKNAGLILLLLGLVLILLGWISVLFGKIIQAAISRQREHLADASAVQFTRNPMGLASALRKIGTLSQLSYIASPAAEEAAHLFFASGLKSFWSNIFATHPPLVKRIQLLDPTFDGDFSKPIPTPTRAASSRQSQPTSKKPPLHGKLAPVSLAILTGSGQGTTESARNVLESLPPQVRELSTDPLGTMKLIFSALLDQNPEVLQVQLNRIARAYGEQMAKHCTAITQVYSKLSRSQKLAQVCVSTPTLKEMSSQQFELFNRVLHELIYANNEVDLFEYCLHKNIEHNLKHYFAPRNRKAGKTPIRELKNEVAVVLSLLARSEISQPKQVEIAFCTGLQHLALENESLELLPQRECTFEALDTALEDIAEHASLESQSALLNACQSVVATTNSQITEDEADLVYAISLALQR